MATGRPQGHTTSTRHPAHVWCQHCLVPVLSVASPLLLCQVSPRTRPGRSAVVHGGGGRAGHHHEEPREAPGHPAERLRPAAAHPGPRWGSALATLLRARTGRGVSGLSAGCAGSHPCSLHPLATALTGTHSALTHSEGGNLAHRPAALAQDPAATVRKGGSITSVLLSTLRSHPEAQQLLVMAYSLLTIVCSQGGSWLPHGTAFGLFPSLVLPLIPSNVQGTGQCFRPSPFHIQPCSPPFTGSWAPGAAGQAGGAPQGLAASPGLGRLLLAAGFWVTDWRTRLRKSRALCTGTREPIRARAR